MEISRKTRDFVRQIDELSNHRLTNQDDVAALVELAQTKDQRTRLEQIAFLAKFLSSTHAILKRSKSDAEGYDKLSSEFQVNLEKALGELKSLIEEAPAALKESFSSKFLVLTGESFENLLSLLYDLSWIKNWYIDRKSVA
jgi:hypothetical protein